MSFGKIFWNGKEVTLGAGDYSANNKVVSLTNNATPPQVDTTIDGNAYIYAFTNGSSSGVNTGGTSAITILQNAGIPLADQWTATDVMSNTCFIIVKINYNKDVQDVNGMPRLSIEVTNTLTKPGAVLLDYMTDTIYGCAIDVANIDTASLTALDVYSDETITYVPVGGGSVTQARYRINGPVNTGDSCLNNLQQLIDTCDSWLQYSELTGKWKVVINKPYTGSTGDLYHVDSSVLIGGIDINPLDLNQTYNSLEVQYPDANISDQTNYKVVDLTDPSTAWYDPTLLSPNEPDNRIVVQFPQVNNYIQAVYLGVRRLLQSREDLVISCQLDYSGIQVEAGDVVRVTLAEYGWTDKLFRVSQVQETKTSDGFLGARITAFEYNATIYGDNAIQDFVPEANTGLSDPNVFDRPGTPVITTNTLANSGAVTSFTVTSTVPASGSTLYMDFNYGNSNNVATHKSYTSTQLADGTPYTNGQSVAIEINDLPIGNYYFSTTARNELAGRASFSSSIYNWGANLQANSVTYTNIGNTVAVSSLLAAFAYEIQSGSTITIPVDISTRATPNEPYYLDGTNPGANYFYPFFQGTSSTANGYLANSTGMFTPAGASDADLTNGQTDWWVHNFLLLPTTIAPTENMIIDVQSQWVSNANAVIQISPMVTTTTSAGYVKDDQFTTTLYMVANQALSFERQAEYSGSSPIDGGGFMIRNMTPGARVYSVSSFLTISKRKT
jgi:hypothetical protein